ncbi:site-specific integrase, partial [Candidatus Magnetobacterium casensis]
DKDSYLWVSEANSNRNEPLIRIGAEKLIHRCFERAGLKHLRHNPHWFRHSRASILSSKLPEVILCRYMGWTLGSQQVKTYCHLRTEQVENAILEMNGVAVQKETQKFKQPVCSCGTTNTLGSRYCYKCGNPLSVDILITDQEIVRKETNDRLKLYAEIMADPIRRAEFEAYKKTIGGTQ